MEHGWKNSVTGKSKCSEKNLPQCHSWSTRHGTRSQWRVLAQNASRIVTGTHRVHNTGQNLNAGISVFLVYEPNFFSINFDHN
jgi:hypothetical protein